ncbi:MAG: DUF3616 domain-containing protein, partial [Cyanobacteria bacterium J06554_3]
KHDPGSGRFAASLSQSKKGNVVRSELTQALKDDQHIGPFLKMRVPSKDNGFDIEAIAVKGHQLFLDWDRLAANLPEPGSCLTGTPSTIGIRASK